MSGVVVWFTGLPSSGKSLLAERTRAALARSNRRVVLLDGDEVRRSLVPTPGYDPEGRDAFYATLGELAALLAKQGLTVLVAATAHRRAYRDAAREKAPRFVEVYVSVPVEECARRDAKGLFAAFREGRIRGVPGADVEYEIPRRPDVIAAGGEDPWAVEKTIAFAEGRRPE